MAKNKMNVFDWLAIVLLMVGGLNWALAIWDINLVTMLLGDWTWAVNTVYGLVGLAFLYALFRGVMAIAK